MPESPPRETTRKLATLFQVAAVLATERDLEGLSRGLLRSLIETLEDVEAGILQLYDPSSGRLTVKAACGYDLATLSQAQLVPGGAPGGPVLEAERPRLYADPQDLAAAEQHLTPENQRLFESARIGARKTQSAICLPLLAERDEVGVLLLENRTRVDAFTPKDVRFLKALADLAALSLHSAREREREAAERTLEETNQLKMELMSTLAHEMRTPLTSIKGCATALLMEEASYDPQTEQELLRTIDQECDTLEELVHDVLESSVIDAGLLTLELQPVRLPHLVQDVLDDIAPRAQNHRFAIDFGDSFPILDADPKRLAQVLRNLLDNAVKYSPEGGLIMVCGKVRREDVVVSVADQGIGIAPEHLNRLFEEFFRVDSGLAHHVVGSGLGLPIARAIVESHGGRIWAKSQVGQGSTFYFTLPLSGPSRELLGRGGEIE